MVYRAGNRFDEENYFLTEIDSSVPSCIVTGELDGEPVEFSGGGGGELTFGSEYASLSESSNIITFSNIPEEPKCIMLACNSLAVNANDSLTYVALFFEYGDTKLIRRYKRSNGEFGETNITINKSYENNVLTLEIVGSFKFYATSYGYTLVYGY